MKQLDDKTKRRIAQENGYKYFEFWEHDIHKNWDDVKLKLTEIIDAN
jgi:very-short-patch-repair endonuclease